MPAACYKSKTFSLTDYTKATGETALADRYKRSAYTCKDGGTSCTSTTRSFSSKLGSPYVTVTLGGHTYEGLFIKQHKETAASAAANAWTSTAAGSEAMCFTLMGRSTERAVWGYMT